MMFFDHLRRILIIFLLIGSPVFVALLFFSSNPCEKNRSFVRAWTTHLQKVSGCTRRQNLAIDLSDLSQKVLGGCVDRSAFGLSRKELCRNLLDEFDAKYPPDIFRSRWSCSKHTYEHEVVEFLCFQSLSSF